jgi:hypothetical protein
MESFASVIENGCHEGISVPPATCSETSPVSDDNGIVGLPAGTPGVTKVPYVQNRHGVGELFDRLTDALIPTKRFYNYNQQLVVIRQGVGPELVTTRNLSGFISDALEIALCKQQDDQVVFKKFALFPPGLATAFITSPALLNRMPTLKAYTSTPVFDRKWNFVNTAGFHSDSGIYYEGPTIDPAHHITMLERVLKDFPWKERTDRLNFTGMLITALTILHWITGKPFCMLNANKAGLGKTLLAKILAILMDGRAPRTITFSFNAQEFEKQIATRVKEGDHVVIIDNAKATPGNKEIESPVLERCITDSTLNFRRLGANASINRPNDVIFCMSMNSTKLGADLRRRNVPVNLYESMDAHRVDYPIPDMERYVLDNRPELIAEIAGLVLRWIQEGRLLPDQPAKHSTSQTWASTMDAILRLNGDVGFLANFHDSAKAFDSGYLLLRAVCEEFHDQAASTASGWVEMLGKGILRAHLMDSQGRLRTPRGQATMVGQLFQSYLGTEFLLERGRFVLKGEDPGSSHHSAKYWFEQC